MSFTLVLVQVKAVLDSVTGIGLTYDYPRWAADVTTQKSLFVTGGKMHVWFIERTSAPSEASVNNDIYRDHIFTLWGYYELDDSAASEKTFQQLCDDICNKFNLTSNLALSGTGDQLKATELTEKTDVMFAGILAHRARISVTVNEDVTQ